MDMDWITSEEFPLPPGYDKLMRRYFEMTIDEDWVLSETGNNDTFFREFRIWKDNMRQIHMGPFLGPEEYNVVRTTMNTYVAKWMEANWVTRYSPDTYAISTRYSGIIPHFAVEVGQGTETSRWEATSSLLTQGLPVYDHLEDDLIEEIDVEESSPHGFNRAQFEAFVAGFSYSPQDFIVNDDDYQRDHIPDPLEYAELDQMYDDVLNGGYDTDDTDMPPLYNTLTGEYEPTDARQIDSDARQIDSDARQIDSEYVVVPNLNEMTADICCICLDPHAICNAVKLKNVHGNVCHEMGMTCFLQWSESSRQRHLAVKCPLCKSNVHAVVYQYGLPTANGHEEENI
jgi:hypothetical protein